MDYRMENLDFELRLVGKGEPVKTSKASKTISTLWNTAKKDGFMQKLIELSWEEPKCTLESLIGVCGKEAVIKDDEFTYFMGVRYDGEPSGNMDTLLIPSSTWLVFANVKEGWERMNSGWALMNGYELADLPCLECYYPPKHKPRHELWVPIKSK